LRAFFLVVLLAMSLVATRAHASGPERIAVVHERAADERAVGRLRAELSTLGYEVVDVTLAPNEGATALDDAARRVNAFAAVHIVPNKGGVEVWIADGATGKTLFRELVIGSGEAFDDVVALKAAELLRASLAELGLSPKPKPTPPPTSTEKPAARPPPEMPEEPPRAYFELGPGVLLSPGGVGANVVGLVGARFRFHTVLGLDAFVALPITPATVSASEGSADVRPWLFGLDLAAWLFDPRSVWQVSGAAGIGVAHLVIEGDPTPPLLGQRETSTVALPFGRVSVERGFGTRFRLGLHGFVGVAAPEHVIRFDGREVATWGRPVVLSTFDFAIALD
jgi:hypothetical protein